MDPNQKWTIAGNIGIDLLLTAGATVIRIPAHDVKKIADYNPYAMLEGAQNGQETKKEERGI